MGFLIFICYYKDYYVVKLEVDVESVKIVMIVVNMFIWMFLDFVLFLMFYKRNLVFLLNYYDVFLVCIKDVLLFIL